MSPPRRHRFPLPTAFLALLIWLVPGSVATAQGSWSLSVEPLFVEVGGHDQRALDIRVDGSDSGLEVTTDSGPGYHLELRRSGETWGWGVDFFWFSAAQSAPSPSVAGTAGEQATFRFADGAYSSAGPGQVLYYNLLEDNDIAAWTVDFYASRRWTPRSRLLFGIRSADFDNDYRAVVGIEGSRGTRLDSSSNYDRMTGPIVGLVVAVERGKNHFEGYVAQSLLLGTTLLTSMQSDFTGPFVGETQEFSEIRTFEKSEDVSIPVTELRLSWAYQTTDRIAFGLGLNTAVWTDVPVPAGVLAASGFDGLDENTIVFTGLAGSVKVSFE